MKYKICLLFIVLIAIAIRVWGVDFGLPYQLHQDEPIVINHALAYGVGDLNPHFFNIPPLGSYILFILYGIYFLIGNFLGAFAGVDDFAISFFKNSSTFYIIGRVALGVIPGTVSVFLTYVLAKSLFSKKTALFSALLMATCFLNVINSHYIYVDSLMVAFVLAVYIFLFKIYHAPNYKNYILAAVFLGLAIGVKYNAAIIGIPFFLTHYVSSKKLYNSYFKIIFSKKIWLAFLTCILVYILTNPFSLLAFEEFKTSFLEQSQAVWHMGPWHHLVYSLNEGISALVLVPALAGIAIMLFKKRQKALIFSSFPLVFYAVLVFYSQPFSRYVLVLLPFIAIGAGYLFFEVIYQHLRRRVLKIALIAISILLIFPSMIKAIKADVLFTSKDTRIISSGWIQDNLPLGSKIACDSTFFRPVIEQPYSQLILKKDNIEKQQNMADLKNKKFEYALKATDKEYQGYSIYFLAKNPKKQGKFLATMPALPFNLNELMKNEIDYVVVNYALTDKIKEKFLYSLKKQAVLIKTFSPYYDKKTRLPYDKFARTCLPIETKELFSKKYTGPCLEIYRLKK